MNHALSAIAAAAMLAGLSGAAHSAALVEPVLHLPPSGHLRVAVTLDACGGHTDSRILSALVDNNIPATIFVTGLWLKHNAEALAVMRSRPDLFELEDHGEKHVPAIDRATRVFGIKAAGSRKAVIAEVAGGAAAMVRAGAPAPKWFRGATAKYTGTSIALIHRLGLKVAGYSLNGDGGSLFGAGTAERRIAAAHDGDVIIAHINQPTHKAGAGVAKGLLDLKARGADFVKLDTLQNDGLPTPGI